MKESMSEDDLVQMHLEQFGNTHRIIQGWPFVGCSRKNVIDIEVLSEKIRFCKAVIDELNYDLTDPGGYVQQYHLQSEKRALLKQKHQELETLKDKWNQKLKIMKL